MANHGTAFRTRWRLLRDRVLAMQAIWTQDEAEFHGRFVNFDKLWSYPKPVQKPYPPVLMGGSGPTTFDRIVEFCDGWMPIPGRMSAGLGSQIAELQARARAAGRGPIPVTAFMPKADPDTLDGLAAAGVERAVLSLPSDGTDSVLRVLDRYTGLMRR